MKILILASLLFLVGCQSLFFSEKQHIQKEISTQQQLVDSAKNWKELNYAIFNLQNFLQKNNNAIRGLKYFLQKNTLALRYIDKLKSKKQLSDNSICLLAALQARFIDKQKAIETLDKRISHSKASSVLYMQKAAILNSKEKFSEAADIYKQILNLDVKPKAEDFLRLINQYRLIDKYPKALKWGWKYRDCYPDNAESWIVLCELLINNKEFDKAVSEAKKAIKIFPDNFLLIEYLIYSYVSWGEKDNEVIKICLNIMQKTNNDKIKIKMFGSICNILKIKNLRKLIYIIAKENKKNVSLELAKAYFAFLDNDTSKLLELQKKKKYSRTALFLLAKSEIKSDFHESKPGSYLKAKGYFENINRLYPSVESKILLVDFYFKYGKRFSDSAEFSRGLALFEEIKNKIDLKTKLDLLAILFIACDENETLIEILSSCKSAIGNINYHYLLGCAYEKNGEIQKAIKEFKNVINLSFSSSLFVYIRPYVCRWYRPKNNFSDKNTPIFKYYKINYIKKHAYSYLNHHTKDFFPLSCLMAKYYSLLHLAKLNKKIAVKNKLYGYLKYLGFDPPGFIMDLYENEKVEKYNLYGNYLYDPQIDAFALYNKYQKSLEVKAFLIKYYCEDLIPKISSENLYKIILIYNKKYPEHLEFFPYSVNDLKKNREFAQFLLVLSKNKKLPPKILFNSLYCWIPYCIKKTFSKKQKNILLLNLFDAFMKIKPKERYDLKNEIDGLINDLLVFDYFERARQVINIHLKMLPEKEYNQRLDLFFFLAPQPELNFDKQTFPEGILIVLPDFATRVLPPVKHRYKIIYKRDLSKACLNCNSKQLRLIANSELGYKSEAEKLANELASNPKATLSNLALSASWFYKEKQPLKAYNTLLKGEKLCKRKIDFIELNRLLIIYASDIKDKKISKSYIKKSANKLYKLPLTEEEKTTLSNYCK